MFWLCSCNLLPSCWCARLPSVRGTTSHVRMNKPDFHINHSNLADPLTSWSRYCLRWTRSWHLRCYCTMQVHGNLHFQTLFIGYWDHSPPSPIYFFIQVLKPRWYRCFPPWVSRTWKGPATSSFHDRSSFDGISVDNVEGYVIVLMDVLFSVLGHWWVVDMMASMMDGLLLWVSDNGQGVIRRFRWVTDVER